MTIIYALRIINIENEKGRERKETMEKVLDMIIESYIKVFGEEKWESLTEEEQHDAIMIIARDMNNQL